MGTLILPDRPGAVVRWKYLYDGAYQYQVAVLSIHTGDYDQGLVWHRAGWASRYWTQEQMQDSVDRTDWGEWEILHPGDEEE